MLRDLLSKITAGNRTSWSLGEALSQGLTVAQNHPPPPTQVQSSGEGIFRYNIPCDLTFVVSKETGPRVHLSAQIPLHSALLCLDCQTLLHLNLFLRSALTPNPSVALSPLVGGPQLPGCAVSLAAASSQT